MAREIAQEHWKQLKRIQKNVESAHDYFKPNIERFHKFRKQVYDTSLSRDEIANLETVGKPPLEFNILEAYISRLRGEFSKQTPSFKVTSQNSSAQEAITLKLVESHLRAIEQDANAEGFSNGVYEEALSGGYSVMKVYTDYEGAKSFNQKIYLTKVYDPTLCGFDPLARLPSKADADYCYELFPKTKSEFERDYPQIKTKHLTFTRQSSGFNWSYRQNDIEIVLLCHYYEKKRTRTKIYQLANGLVLNKNEYNEYLSSFETSGSIEEPAAITDQRYTNFESVVRYTFIDDQLIDYEETDFNSLPLIFNDGNSAIINNYNSETGNTKNSIQMTRPYIYHALDMQKLKNYAGETLAAELQNMVMHKFLVEQSSIPEKYLEAWINPQIPGSLVWQSRDKNNEPLPAPTPVPRVPMPPEIFNTFDTAEKTIQNILGSYDASLGINNNQLSGIAIVEGATQSNNTAMPYVMNYLAALTQAANVILELIPKYYKTPRTIPIVDDEGHRMYIKINDQEDPNSIDLNLSDNVLDVRVKAGVNFEVQKNRSLQTITQLMSASEGFKGMMEQFGLPILVDNLDIRGQEELKTMARTYMQQLAQQRQAAQQAAAQGQMNNPQAQLVAIEKQKADIQARKQAAEEQYNGQKIVNERAKLELEQYKAELQALEDRRQHYLDLAKAETDKDIKSKELAQTQIKQDNENIREFFRLTQPKLGGYHG